MKSTSTNLDPLPLSPDGESLAEFRPKSATGHDSMKFAEFLSTARMLTALDKESAVHEMVDTLVHAGRIAHEFCASVVAAILEREARCGFSIGESVAIPHARHSSVTHLVGAVGVCRHGIDFHSADGQPVKLVVLLVAPPHRPGDHLRALEKLSRELRDTTLRRALVDSNSVEQVLTVLKHADGICPL